MSGEHNKEVSAGEHLDLAPVEIAYLTGGGDTTFALSVLVFDMLHREVKFRINSTTELLLPSTASNNTFYESKLQGLIKSSLKNWGERTV
ncbi:MAG: hypothetical protein WCT03_07925, partial [Candidatus Obscuribacterales bacterium]